MQKDRVLRLLQAVSLPPDGSILIHKPSNMFYLSGYTGEGLLVLTHKSRTIVTDFRYVEQAESQAPGFAVASISIQRNHAQLTAELLQAEGIRIALYEDDKVTVRSAKKLEEALAGIHLLSLENAPEKLREIKDEAEIKAIETACQISSEAFEFICGYIKPGMTELHIQRSLNDKMLELGAEGTAFDSIIASGPNGSLPHAIPGERQVQVGDMITLDFGARYQGYCADMTRTIALGRPSEKMLEVFHLVLAAQEAAQAALAPGRACKEVDTIARDMISAAGYGQHFGHGLGHAVGIDVHEDPRLSQASTDTLKPGHVVTVEPGVYLPGIGGVRIENTCLITEKGAKSLVSVSKELRII